jgi:branched-chain amino acid transport system substrate-binding protein
METYKEVYESLGGTVVETLTFKSGDNDFNAQLTRIAASAPDILYIPAYYTDIAQIAQQARTLGIDALLIGADGWDGVLDVIADKSAVEGAIFTGHFLPTDPSQTVQDFVKLYKDAYGKDPNAFAALGYDTAAIICKAIEDAGSTDSAEIVKAMQSLKIAGVTSEQEISFDEGGNPVKGITLIQIKDGVNAMLTKYRSE